MKETLNVAPDAVPVLADKQVPKRGRPVGQFDYHKHLVLQFLQKFTQEQGTPFEGTNEELVEAIGQWGDHFRVGVSVRQIARYLRKLQEETLPDGKGRIEIVLRRFKRNGGTFGSRRLIHVNDLRNFSSENPESVS